MASKNYIDVIIDGKIYNIGGFESEAYLQKVASYINNMIMEFKQNENYRMQKMDMQRITYLKSTLPMITSRLKNRLIC